MRVLKAITSPWVFSLFIGFLFYKASLPLTSTFIGTQGLISFLAHSISLAQAFPEAWKFMSLSYSPLVGIVGAMGGWYIYQMLFSEVLNAESKVPLALDEVRVPPFPWNPHELRLVVGLQHQSRSLEYVAQPRYMVLEKTAMFQNVLISGTIGTGKTAAVMYPLLKQALFYEADNPDEKAGALILDVKGNFYQMVTEYARAAGREDDLVVIQLGGAYTYNPVHKPLMEAVDLADRCRVVMDLFNTGARKDAFWDTKAAAMMTECIRLLRSTLGYCTLGDIHRLVTDTMFLQNVLEVMDKAKRIQRLIGHYQDDDQEALCKWFVEVGANYRDADKNGRTKLALKLICHELLLVVNSIDYATGQWPLRLARKHFSGVELSSDAKHALLNFADAMVPISDFDYRTCSNYFANEFRSKAETTIETIKTVVTQMTAFFASSEGIARSFSPPKESLNFFGFEEAINHGKIVVLAMNIAENPQVSRTIAAYLKLDFQAEIRQRSAVSRQLNKTRPMFFICDEYQEFVTANDGDFYGVSREARCCSIVASQSYTSILKALGGARPTFETLVQNLVTKIALRSDDKLTIETMQLLTGKIEKERTSRSISESANNAGLSGVFGTLTSEKASINESINVSTVREALFEERDFTQTLKQFTAIAFLAGEDGMQEPTMVHLMPYFQSPIVDKIHK